MDREGVVATKTRKVAPVETLETEHIARGLFGMDHAFIPRARTANDKCPAYATLLESNDGKVPANYESAYNKAKKACVEAKKSKCAHAKAMKTEEFDRYEDTKDEDASSDEDGASTFGLAMLAKGIKPKAAPPVA